MEMGILRHLNLLDKTMNCPEKLVIIGMAPTEELIAIGMAPTEPWISDSTVQICLTPYTFFRSLNQSPRVLHVSRGFKWLQQNPI